MKTAVLMRHGQTESYGPEGDRSRTLTPAGREQARAVGERLKREGIAIDYVLCSPASRAHETAQLVTQALAFAGNIDAEEALYGASDDRYLQALRNLSDSVNVVLLVAHNPGIGVLASKLCGGSADLAPAQYVIGRFSIEAWAELAYAP